jgi:hypothetical protein
LEDKKEEESIQILNDSRKEILFTKETIVFLRGKWMNE